MTVRGALQIFGALALLCRAAPAGAADELPLAPVLTDVSYPEGPLADGDSLLFADMTRGEIVRFDGKTARRWAMDGCGPTSLARFGGGLVATCHLAGALAFVQLPDDSAQATESAARIAVNRPNDCSAGPGGAVFVSSSGEFAPGAPAEGALLRLEPTRTLTAVAAGLRYANGVAAPADGGPVLLSEHLAGRVWRVTPDGERTRFADIADRATPLSGPDGIEILPDGRVLVAVYGEGRIDAFDARGRLLFRFRAPADYPVLTNVALMQDGRTVYATASAGPSRQRGAILAGRLPSPEPE